MAKNISYFLISILVPGLSLALHGYYRPAFLYPILICFFITFSAHLGYFFRPVLSTIVIISIFFLAVASSIHGLLQIHYGPVNHRGWQFRFLLCGHILLWLFLVTGLLFFRQAWLDLEIYSIQGESMTPTLVPNDIVVAEIIPSDAQLHENDVVVFAYPESNKVLIKRYVPLIKTDVDDQSSLFLLGDNPANSLDSRIGGVRISGIKQRGWLAEPCPHRRVIAVGPHFARKCARRDHSDLGTGLFAVAIAHRGRQHRVGCGPDPACVVITIIFDQNIEIYEIL